ncbi:MAG: hypothetical protein KatS3mg131_2444 [Candidatus Tectimicrobiota bacterium]|nr:MAG: hypothetical protein KatS3mg131_2444 [Candidatus Tectomicrobia bacterium]
MRPFAWLPPQPPMSPAAEAYAAECLRATAAVQARTRHVLDMAFGPDPWQKLDLYLPEAAGASGLPTLLFMHGGYWTHGHKEWMGFMAPAFTSLPALFISVGYRLAPAAKYPAALEDCLAALHWAYHHVADYGGDPQRLFVGGHSAGGHLATLMTLRPSLLIAWGLPAAAIKGCIAVSGVYDLSGDLPQDRLRAFLPPQVSAAEASPIAYVAGNRTPLLLVVGEHDFPVLRQQAYAMAAALKAAGSPYELLDLPGVDHFQISLQGADVHSPWVQRARKKMGSEYIFTEEARKNVL